MMNLLTLGQSSLPMKAIEIEREYPTKVTIKPSASGALKGASIGVSISSRLNPTPQAIAISALVGGVVGGIVGPED
ncbi:MULTISPECIES: hypothetical protein [Vibrio]|uniref:hypothetical protein n=1 Tax=Vibrio TaxID=662 RepID=UPI000D386A91|nr:hypothetical protein [Vibrio splendidus]PTP27534.1 hypothetical protein CWN95_23590 [Vibrio splendidus]